MEWFEIHYFRPLCLSLLDWPCSHSRSLSSSQNMVCWYTRFSQRRQGRKGKWPWGSVPRVSLYTKWETTAESQPHGFSGEKLKRFWLMWVSLCWHDPGFVFLWSLTPLKVTFSKENKLTACQLTCTLLTMACWEEVYQGIWEAPGGHFFCHLSPRPLSPPRAATSLRTTLCLWLKFF